VAQEYRRGAGLSWPELAEGSPARKVIMKIISSTRRILAAGAALVLLPVLAGAQEPVKSFDQLNTRLKVGDTIWVTDAQGREIKGKIRDLGPSALTLDSGTAAIVQADAVRLIVERKPRPIARGALWGLGIGAAAGLALGIAVVAGCDDGDECAGAILVLGGLFGGWGAGTGAVIGALIPGKTLVLYRAPGATGASSARFSLAPVITPRHKGVAVSFSF
jgi:hypothetical protein